MFTVCTDRPLLSTDPSDRLLRVEIQVPRPASDEARKPVHLSLVIDRSGSMGGEKMAMALLAARQGVRTLADGDSFSIVTFDDRVELLVASTPATPEARVRAETSLDTVTARGSTDLGGGWLRGCEEVGRQLPADAVGRCLVITDGQANQGISDPGVLAQHARAQRLRRVTTSTLGLGDGFNEFLLGRLSEEGGGNFYFAARADELPGLVARELGDVLAVVARDATIHLDVPAGVEVESLNDYPCAREGDSLCFSPGSLTGGMVVAAVFRLRFAAGPAGERLAVAVRLDDRDAALPRDACRVEWTRVAPAEVDAAASDVLVTRRAAALDAARARRAALELNQSGRSSEAVTRMASAAALLRSYAGGDPEILGLAGALTAEENDYARPMSSMSGKGRYLQAMRMMKQGLGAPRVLGLPTTPRLSALVHTAIRALGAVADGPPFVEDGSLIGTAMNHGPLTEESERALVAGASAIESAAIKVVFVEPPLHNNWFSHWHAHERTAVVSLAGVDQLIPFPLATFAAYSLTLYGLCVFATGYAPMRVFHRDTRACLFDLCGQKEDVKIKLQAGHICSECSGKIDALGLDGTVVRGLWRAVQGLAQSPR